MFRQSIRQLRVDSTTRPRVGEQARIHHVGRDNSRCHLVEETGERHGVHVRSMKKPDHNHPSRPGPQRALPPRQTYPPGRVAHPELSRLCAHRGPRTANLGRSPLTGVACAVTTDSNRPAHGCDGGPGCVPPTFAARSKPPRSKRCCATAPSAESSPGPIPNRSTSDNRVVRSPPQCDERSSPAINIADGPAARSLPDGAKPTTSNTGNTAETRASPTEYCSVLDISPTAVTRAVSRPRT